MNGKVMVVTSNKSGVVRQQQLLISVAPLLPVVRRWPGRCRYRLRNLDIVLGLENR